jgi:hypothetical protein
MSSAVLEPLLSFHKERDKKKASVEVHNMLVNATNTIDKGRDSRENETIRQRRFDKKSIRQLRRLDKFVVLGERLHCRKSFCYGDLGFGFQLSGHYSGMWVQCWVFSFINRRFKVVYHYIENVYRVVQRCNT